MLSQAIHHRRAGLVWASVLCPPIGILLGFGVAHLMHGVSLTGGLLLYTAIPVALAVGGNAMLGREGRSLVVAAALAAVVSVAGLVLLTIVWLMTLPEGYFN